VIVNTAIRRTFLAKVQRDAGHLITADDIFWTHTKRKIVWKIRCSVFLSLSPSFSLSLSTDCKSCQWADDGTRVRRPTIANTVNSKHVIKFSLVWPVKLEDDRLSFRSNMWVDKFVRTPTML
jgi:hypothetical protein